MKTDFLIIGGGVAGLSAANHLADAGVDVTLLEAGKYPSHKICGEFLSPEALPILESWEIDTGPPIHSLKMVLPHREWSMELPHPAAALQRYRLDHSLARRAERKGAQIITSAVVERMEMPKREGDFFHITTADGKRWKATTLLLSTGRLTGQRPPKFRYLGAKAHYEGIQIPHQLVMFLLPGAYFGMVPIGPNRVNVAGLISSPPEKSIASFFSRAKARPLVDTLETGNCLFDDWMTAPIPQFGLRNPPLWPNTYFFGDAIGVIPPATGDGLAMGLTSGILAAEYALRGSPDAYRARWRNEYAKRISWGLFLHRFFLSSPLAQAIPWISRLFPFLPPYIFRATRGKRKI